MTIRAALNVSHRPVSYRDAEVLLGACLNQDRAWLLAHPETELTPAQESTYLGFLALREQNQPVAYITGRKEFYGRPFQVDQRVLIPRPETEGMVELARDFAQDFFAAHTKASNKPCPVRILELGTGSGAVSVSLALELAERNIPADILATDLSPEALEVATENWSTLNTNPHPFVRVQFVAADLFDHPTITKKAPYDLVLANLPYVEDEWKMNPAAQAEVVFHEPDVALFGGAEGLDIYQRFFQSAPHYLASNGCLVIEHGERQTEAITALARQAFSERTIETRQDYAGLDRLLCVR